MFNDKLTIIIPTHERHNLLLRAIDYYSELNVDVIIVDSSMQELKEVLPDRFLYMHMPAEEFGNKIFKALSQVSTKYSCLSADDDFLSESGLISGVDFLDENDDYVSVQGRYISYNFDDSGIATAPMYTKALFYSVDSESRAERVKQAFNPYMHHIYALHRTDILKKSFLAVSTVKSTSPVEMVVPLVSAIYGKHMLLSTFWMARDQNVYTSTINEEGVVERQNAYEVKQEPVTLVVADWNAYFSTEDGKLFKKNFCSVISDVVEDEDEKVALFDSAFATYTLGLRKKHAVANPGFLAKVMRTFKASIKKILPGYFLYMFRFLKSMLFSYKNPLGYPWSDVRASEDWKNIKSAILKYGDMARPN